jgi:hypothetical protein
VLRSTSYASKISAKPRPSRTRARHNAEILQITQPRVHRLLKSVELDGGDVPVTPREQIYRAALENSSRAELINWLVSYPHTFTEYAPEPFDGSIPGTWTEVRTALLTGLLSQEEYDQIAEKVHPPVSA